MSTEAVIGDVDRIIDDKKHDLLTHRCRPNSVNRFVCHANQALRLKEWIQEYFTRSKRAEKLHSDDEDSSFGSNSNTNMIESITNCALLTGPPGIGKTSLVYTVANELNMHVVESNPSEKRDSKLFGMLKLTNQKGKLNPIAKLFQAAHQQKSISTLSRRKRRRLIESTENKDDAKDNSKSAVLSLSGDTSIILFDDVDVVFEEDGPFLKSLVDFIKESKRPVVLTATKSIEYIKEVLIHFEHINLNKPVLEDCTRLLIEICKQEKFKKLSRISKCQRIANYYNCDIRQCLNRIHFYGDQSDRNLGLSTEYNFSPVDFTKIDLNYNPASPVGKNQSILNAYMCSSLLDHMDHSFNFFDRSTLLKNWLDGKPSVRNEEHSFEHELGEQIRDSIAELGKKLYFSEMMDSEDLHRHTRTFTDIKNVFLNASSKINEKIKSRIETVDKEFYVDIVPLVSELVKIDSEHKTNSKTNGFGSLYRRARRPPSYLDTIQVFFESADINLILDNLSNLVDIPTEP